MTLDGLAFDGLAKAFFSTVEQRYPLTDAEVDAIREFRAESMLTQFPEMVWRAVLDAMLGHVDALRAENDRLGAMRFAPQAPEGGRVVVEGGESAYPRLQALLARIWARHLREQADQQGVKDGR